MVKHAPGLQPDTCPHVDRNDPRCGHRFSLGRIDQAFRVCFGAFHGCPMYHRMNREDSLLEACARDASSHAACVMVTADGQPVALRPTGS